MKVMHLHADLIGWEERGGMHELPAVEVTKEAIYFDGLTHLKENEKTRRGRIRVGHEDGSVEDVEFIHERKGR